jgi:polyphosphate glucokinase
MAERSRAAEKGVSANTVRTLAIDVGGTGIKALTLDHEGKPLTERVRIPTPKPAKPKAVIRAICKLAETQPGFERVSASFPGVIKGGVVYTAPNLGKGWSKFDLRKALQEKFRRPVRVANDAVVQGSGAVSGRGVELVITLGTGFGSALFDDGRHIPLELGHHPFRKGKTYEEELGAQALAKKGKKKWNAHLREAIECLRRTFNYDRLYIGGGNARCISFKLPDNVKVVGNIDGLLGGIALWNQPETERVVMPAPARRRLQRVRRIPVDGQQSSVEKSEVAQTAPAKESGTRTQTTELPDDEPS